MSTSSKAEKVKGGSLGLLEVLEVGWADVGEDRMGYFYTAGGADARDPAETGSCTIDRAAMWRRGANARPTAKLANVASFTWPRDDVLRHGRSTPTELAGVYATLQQDCERRRCQWRSDDLR